MIRRPRKRMTLASLKRHIDRRFATKADLRQFATKADLHQFATKRDLCRFATKRDLRRFATKAELRFATKEDVAAPTGDPSAPGSIPSSSRACVSSAISGLRIIWVASSRAVSGSTPRDS